MTFYFGDGLIAGYAYRSRYTSKGVTVDVTKKRPSFTVLTNG